MFSGLIHGSIGDQKLNPGGQSSPLVAQSRKFQLNNSGQEPPSMNAPDAQE
ncbi:hypothetical protein PGT21_024692 [Puccinia graminis f. sp. tritici]|uniref:Uncharacterized protein n=1 Tax=Puccinia graminis f. sp. tritici TaxID=56615 RepID=A0A5B0PLR1_PUCGR|nr:hypothetical protein PGT21_024692 [Puccinia graminis f. sp. tritici]